jgi:tetratricopeptide (TPR) repeat protein/tRNA A-37 threonylcarbamoyl transferase component Bud32/TolB-like protein
MIGSSFGHYKIEAQLGSGGMGVVYRAYDTMLRRRVAIKFLKDTSDDQNRARLLKEARAASALNHPNICTVHEVEEVDDQACIVMEYVQGVQLESMIVPGGLPSETFFRYALQIADALMHAHDRGIVHRDLKSANVIVATEGRLKVLDFGLAHRLPEYETDNPTQSISLIAQPETVAGTLAYIAPEVLKTGLSDARSDVWSLGVLFYEMASGRQPYQGIRGLELVSKVIEDHPVPPLSSLVQGSLRAIVHRCLQKDPARRYQNCREVFAALEHAQSGPKWSLPVKIGVGAAALLVLAIGGSAAYRQFATREPVAETPAPSVPSTITARRAVAVLGFKNLSGQPAAAWLSTALAEMLTTELSAGEQLRTIPGENVARMKSDLELADADSFAPDTLTRINTSLGSDIVVFGSYAVIGDAIRFDVRMQDARAGDTIAAVAETGPESELFEIVSTIGSRLRDRLGVTGLSPAQVASVEASLPSNPAAARLYAEGLAQLRLYDAQSARRSLEQAVNADPKLPLAHSALALAWSALGYDERAKQSAKRAYELSGSLAREDRMWVEGRFHDAMNEHEEAIKTYQALYSFFPDNLEYGLQLVAAQEAAGKGQDALGTIESLRRLAPPVRDDPRIDRAEASAAASLSDYRRQQGAAARAVAKARQQGARLLVASALLTEGNAWQELGDPPKAIAAAEEAREIYASAGDRGGESRALRAAGISLRSQGDLAAARRMYERGLAVARDIGDQSTTAGLLNNIANVQRQQGSLAEALKTYKESLAISREIGDRNAVALTLNNMAIGLRVQGDLAGAKKNYEEALAIRRATGEKAGMAATLNNLANLMSDQGDLSGATKLYEETRQTAEEIGDRRSVAMAWYNLGEMERLQGNLSRSRTSYDQALTLRRAIEDKSAVARTLASIGLVQAAQARLTEARKTYEEALALLESVGEKQGIARVHNFIGTLNLYEGRIADAQKLLRQAAIEFRDLKAADEHAATLAVLAKALLAEGKNQEADKTIQEALRLVASTSNRQWPLEVGIAAGRVESATGKRGAAVTRLRKIRDDAKGFMGIELDADLALGEVEIASGQAAQGRARLESLEQRARSQGFLLIANQAAAAR